MISRLVLIPALIALVGAVGFGLHWRNQLGNARAEIDRINDNVTVLEEERDQAAAAYEVLKETSAAARERAAEYAAFERAIMEGEDDVELPAWFTGFIDDYVDRLRSTGNLAPGRGDGSE